MDSFKNCEIYFMFMIKNNLNCKKLFLYIIKILFIIKGAIFFSRIKFFLCKNRCGLNKIMLKNIKLIV